MLSLSDLSAFQSGVYQACECVKPRERKTERVTRGNMCARATSIPLYRMNELCRPEIYFD